MTENDSPYRLRPSAAHRWVNCPGSVRREHDTGDEDETGPAASEGQAAHAMAAAALHTGQPAAAWRGHFVSDDDGARTWEMDSDRCDAVQEYLDVVRAQPGGLRKYEERVSYVPLRGWASNGTRVHKILAGTTDALIYDAESRTLRIVDLKFGRNVVVEAQDNWQLLIYALLAAYTYRLQPLRYEMHIVQPRAAHDDGPHRVWTVDADAAVLDLEVADAVAKAGAPDAPLNPAPDGMGWCRFCSARGDCPARARQAESASRQLAETAGSNLAMPVPPGDLDNETLAQVLPWLDIIERWGKDARAEALKRAETGSLPGYKRVAGRSSRKWADGVSPAQVDEALSQDPVTEGVDIYRPSELLSVAQLEKALGKRRFKEILGGLVAHSTGAPKLVPDSAPGDPLPLTAQGEFEGE